MEKELTLRERLADYAHIAWGGWMKYLFKKSTKDFEKNTITIPPWAVERWTRQLNTDYVDLTEQEQRSDLAEADEILKRFDKIVEGLQEISRDAWSGESVRLNPIGRKADELLEQLGASHE